MFSDNLVWPFYSIVRMNPRMARPEQQTPVRFEHLDDLPVDRCHKLLAKYMPKGVTMNKTYQKLFIG